MNNSLAQFLVLLGGIITIAIVAVVVSQKSNSSGVITSFFNGFSTAITAAVSPVTGTAANITNPLNMGSSGLGSLGI